MIRKILAVHFLLGLLLIGCTSKRNQTFAHITERKHLDGGKLLISYSFANEGKLYKGDTIISNKVIANDSFLVIFSPENPAEGKLLIP